MHTHPTVYGSAFYSIQLQGILDPDWAEEFGKLKVITVRDQDSGQEPVTTLIGQVTDQAALAGLLNLANSLGLPLLSVTFLGTP